MPGGKKAGMCRAPGGGGIQAMAICAMSWLYIATCCCGLAVL